MELCPRHQTELSSQWINDREVNECPSCKGLWVPGSSIDSLLGTGQMLQLRSLCSILKSDLACPGGCGQLHQGKVGQVTVDLCQACGGLWLDPGELETLRQRKGITPYVPASDDGSRLPSPDDSPEIILLALAMFC